MRRQAGRALAGWVMCVALAGCRHKDTAPALPVPPPAPVPVVPVTEPPATVTPIPTVPPPIAPVVVPARKVRRAKKKVAPATGLATTAPGPATPPPANPALLGALTAGDDQTPRKQQEAQALIEALGHRLNGLPASVQQARKDQIAQVVHFEREATKALQGGDADGAVTLATKAKLLLDDLLK